MILGVASTLAIVNNAAVDVDTDISVRPAFSSFSCTPRTGIAGLYDDVFNFEEAPP